MFRSNVTAAWQSLRYGARVSVGSPGFTATVMLTLALGVGVDTALFGVVNAVLLRPLPFPESSRLVSLTSPLQKGPFVLFQGQVRSFEPAGYSEAHFNLTLGSSTIRLQGAYISAGFLPVLRVQPAIGRALRTGEDQPGRDRIAILGYSLWRQRFKGDPAVVGHVVLLNGSEHEIVGVMPPAFSFPGTTSNIWVPLRLDPSDFGDYWGNSQTTVIGRLHRGVPLMQARNEVRALVPMMRKGFPWKMPKNWGAAMSLTTLRNEIVGSTHEELFILSAAAGLVLLIACANIAGLLLARAAGRQQEVAVRAALGASPTQIIQQLLVESCLLAFVGGLFGLAFAFLGLNVLKSILSVNIPRIGAATVDGRVLTFALTLAVLSGILFGLAPALTLSSGSSAESLKLGRSHPSGGRSHRLQEGLVVVEVAISIILVISTTLLLESLRNLMTSDLGFRREHIVLARISPSEQLCGVPGRCENFYSDLLKRVSALPGVAGAAAVSAPPLEGNFGDVIVANVEDYIPPPGESASLLLERVITPGYLRAMGIPLIRGRGFTPADTAPNASRVVLVSASTATRFWPGEDPLGKFISPVWLPGEKRRVVGILGNTREYTLVKNLPVWAAGEVYIPYGPAAIRANGVEGPFADMTLVVRTIRNPTNIAAELASIVSGLGQNIPPPGDVKTMDTVVDDSAAAPRSAGALVGVFAAFALGLGALGIYGLVSYVIARRSHELGVRMALGARPGDIFRLVLWQGARLSLLGVVVGFAAALAVTRFLRSLLYGIRAADPLAFLFASLFLLAVALTAAYIPARRAARIDPVVALRCE